MSEGTGPIRRPAVTSSDVLLAAGLLRSRVHRTPVLTSTTADRLATECLGGSYPVRLAFKCENLQRIGAFKVRGATNAILQVLQSEPKCTPSTLTVITHSSGNHAQGLAYAARA
ncbi:hypothetical protein FRC12_020795, partial [Ceratobasidium sp. 428]